MKKNFFFAIILHCTLFSAQVGIKDYQEKLPTNYTFPESSAALDIYSSYKGVLLPRVNIGTIGSLSNSTAPINQPTQGLILYNTTENTNSTPKIKKGIYYWENNTTNNRQEYNKVLTFNETPKTLTINFNNSFKVLENSIAGTQVNFLQTNINVTNASELLTLDSGYFSSARVGVFYVKSGVNTIGHYGIYLPAGTYSFDVNYVLNIRSSYVNTSRSFTLTNPNNTASQFYDVGYFCDFRMFTVNTNNSLTNPSTVSFSASRNETHNLTKAENKHTATFLHTQTFAKETFVSFNIGRVQGTSYYDAADLLQDSFIKITQISY